MQSAPEKSVFILEALDVELWCPVLVAKFEVACLDDLRAILGEMSAGDPRLARCYPLDAAEREAIEARFGVGLDLAALGPREVEVRLWRRPPPVREAPYLIHTNFELPLMLEGRKKLAFMYYEYPPHCFPGEDSFDRWVERGILHKEVVLEPFEPNPGSRFDGIRTAYYTPKGEEWRIPAFRQLRAAAEPAGGWNETFERLEGMLLGYEDWQNDWWIASRVGAWAGLALCCTVSAEGLRWIEAAGYRALPPCEGDFLRVTAWRRGDEAELGQQLLSEPEAAALVGFNLPGRAIMDFVDPREGGPWLLPVAHIPHLNGHLLRKVEVLALSG
ncbi:hypothetical protein ASF53_23085 [Methylobacterium sp. Leaf123]|nr:hypothetical protein ASF53_23085 [Methylobacterium sp. Leaf123]